MLKNCKKTMAFLLAAALLLSVTACGAGQKKDNGSGGAQVSGGTASTENAASVKPEEQAFHQRHPLVERYAEAPGS